MSSILATANNATPTAPISWGQAELILAGKEIGEVAADRPDDAARTLLQLIREKGDGSLKIQGPQNAAYMADNWWETFTHDAATQLRGKVSDRLQFEIDDVTSSFGPALAFGLPM